MGRKKITSDATVLAATARVINAVGPARLTLAAVAKESGISPATLLQRFGSKRGLLLALAETSAGGVQEYFDRVRRRHRSPLKALLAAVGEFASLAETPQALANNLAFLQIDLTDPDFHRHALTNIEAAIAAYRSLLDQAVAARELLPCDTPRLARAISSLAGGSLVNWAILRRGSARRFVRRDLEMLLAPLRR